MTTLLRATTRKHWHLTVLIALTCILLLQSTQTTTSAQPAPNCTVDQRPEFVFGFAALKDQIGDAMGEPIECEHANPGNGDTLQQTTTGLAFYRKSTNIPTFTNGSEHWGLTISGLVFWTGLSIDPPGVVVISVPATPSPMTATPTAPTATPTPVAPTPTTTPVAMLYRGDPQTIMLQPSDIGAGWTLTGQYQDAPNQYSSGGLHAIFRAGSRSSDPSLAAFVEVYNSIETADAGFRSSASYTPGSQSFHRCDADFARPNSDGSVLLECRSKNVRLIVNFAPSELAQKLLQVMVDRVNARAQ